MNEIKNLLTANIIALYLCLIIWSIALYTTGAKVDYRTSDDSGFIALRLSSEAGISYQWSFRGYSVGFWAAKDNTRLLPVE